MSVRFVDLARLHANFGAELRQAWERVTSSGWYVLGPELEAFEEEFAAYCGGAHCVGMGNGLDALSLALHAMEVGPGDEVIVPSNTYIASWLAVSRIGAVPVPVEPREDTYNIDPAQIEKAITPKTRAILPVDLYGQLADVEGIRLIAKRCGLKVLEDAAQAHGARSPIGGAGTWADAGAFSFFPTKNLGCLGDGGAVVTNDEELADRLRLLRNYGSRKKYLNEVAGWNSRLDALQAAFLRVKLKYLDDWNLQRRRIALQYSAELADLPGLGLPSVSSHEEEHVWHLYVVRHPRRDDLQHELAAAGIETIIHYPIPPHLSQAYANVRIRTKLPIAEQLASQVLSLPIGPHISSGEAAAVIRVVRQFCVRHQDAPAIDRRPAAI